MGASAVIEWRVRDSLLSYMQRDPSFSVRTDGGAELDGGIARMPARRAADGTIAATGEIVLSAHGGALQVPLVAVAISDAALRIADPLEEQDARTLLLLERPIASGDEEEIPVRLAGESDVLFLYSYLPDAPFGSLRVRSA